MARPDGAHDLAQHRGELEVGVLQRFLDALHMAGLLAHELLAGAQQGAQLLGRRLRHEARADQAVRQQVGQPDRIGDIGLAAGHVLDVGGVGQDQREVAIGEDMPDRLPVDTGRLHRDMGAAALCQPGGQRQQPGGCGVETAHLGSGRAVDHNPDRGNHRILVHVEPRADHGDPALLSGNTRH